jgi:hypothetical protein
MLTQAEVRDAAFSGRARLLAFEYLLRHGVNVYAPVVVSEGIDGLVRCEDGRYLELIVRPSVSEHTPLRFGARAMEPRETQFVVCVAWPLSPVQFWVIPSAEFDHQAERYPDGQLELDLEAVDPVTGQKRKVALSQFRNAWRLVVDRAVKSLVAY